jgi:DNA polymerase III epsilon subunit-like protein
MSFPYQPARVYDRPAWEWVDACVEAEAQRLELVRRYGADELDQAARREVQMALLANPDYFTQEVKMLKNRFRPVLVFDTETTGLGPLDAVIQLGYCVLVDGVVVEEYERIWQGDTPSNPFALKVHQIPNRAVLRSPFGARAELEAFADLAKRVHAVGGVLVAHNAQFDVRMLDRTAKRTGLTTFDIGPVFCTATHLKHIPALDRGPNCKNEQVYKHLGGPPLVLHQALNDARATAYIYEEGRKRKWW